MLAFTTDCANLLILLVTAQLASGSSDAVQPTCGPKIKRHERLFDRPMGLFVAGESLWKAAVCQLWRFNAGSDELGWIEQGQFRSFGALPGFGWNQSSTDFELLEGCSDQLATIDWADHHPITVPDNLFHWSQLSEPQRAQYAAFEAPSQLQPSADPQGVQPLLCLALLYHNIPVSWLIAHPIGAADVHRSSFDAAPGHRGRVRALALPSDGFRRQQDAVIPTTRAATTRRNRSRRNITMLPPLKHHLGMQLSSIGPSSFLRGPRLQPPSHQASSSPDP